MIKTKKVPFSIYLDHLHLQSRCPKGIKAKAEKKTFTETETAAELHAANTRIVCMHGITRKARD